MKYSPLTTFKILLSSVFLILRFLWVVPASILLFSFFRNTKIRSPKNIQDFHDIPIFLWSQVIWHEVWQRPQEFCSRLSAKRHVVYFSPAQIHRKYDSLKTWNRTEIFSQGKGFIVSTPLIFPGEYKSKFIAAINKILIESEIRLLLYKHPEYIFMTNSPFTGEIPRKFKPVFTVYDIIDDFIAFDWSPPDSIKLEEELFKITDLVFTGTSTLLDKKKKYSDDIHFIQCGVKFEMFNIPLSKEIPDDIKNVKRPILGYTGSISDRTDSALIKMLSEKFPESSIIMIGPIHGSFGEPPKSANIFYLGLKPHSELPNYLQHFDVCLMPFKLTEAALAINPVKTLEYLAAGKPVVSTAIPDVIKFYSELVAIADSKEHFIALVKEMLEKDQSERVIKGIERARNSSWDAMTFKMDDIIEDRLKKKVQKQ